MAKKKLNRKPNRGFLSVVPVTSRETTGTTPRQPNLRAIMKQRVAIISHRMQRDLAEMERIQRAIIALGTLKERKTK